MWNLRKIGIDDLIYKAAIQTQMKRTNVDTNREAGGWDELGLTYIHY